MDEDVGGLDDEGHLVWGEQAREAESVNQAEVFDLLFVFVGEYPVADEEPDYVWELVGECFCGFDYEFVAFEVKQACDGDEDDCVGLRVS